MWVFMEIWRNVMNKLLLVQKQKLVSNYLVLLLKCGQYQWIFKCVCNIIEINLDFKALQGKALSFRSCQNNPNIHLGMCHKVKIAGATTNICFCHSDGCNGSRRSVIPSIFWKMIFTIMCLLKCFQCYVLFNKNQVIT